MHYRDGNRGLQVLEPVDTFLRLFPASLVHHLDGNTLSLTSDTPEEIVVFTYQE